KTNEANTQKSKTVYESVNRDKVIIEDWNSDDEDDVSEVQIVSPVKTNETQISQEPKLKTVVNSGLRVDKPVDISFVGLDEYAIRKKIIESKTTELNADTSKYKTSETVGNTNEVNIEKPKTVYESVNKDKVIIEDWNSDDEDDVSEVQTVSPVKTNETQTVKTRVDKIG
ncbi:hypothetical protein Tco_0028836, partial [Tanacetum coccineum]